MKKKHISIILMLLLVVFLSSCDDITRNLNIFSWLHQDKTTEEQLEKADYYMDKKSQANYQKAMDIYAVIRASNPYNSDAVYGYATAYAKYHEIQEQVVPAGLSLIALMADFKSLTPVTLFERLYKLPEEDSSTVMQSKQIATFKISVAVSNLLDGKDIDGTDFGYSLVRDTDNVHYTTGRIESQDIWLDAVIAYIHRCHSTLSTIEGNNTQPESIFKLEWNPVTKTLDLSTDGYNAWIAQMIDKAVQMNNAMDASKEALYSATQIITIHTGSDEFEELAKELEQITDAFDDFILYLQGI